MAINIGKNTDGDVTYKNPPVDRVLFPNIKEGATPEEIQDAVDAWLEEHPEATTTVQDGSILPVKLDSSNNASDGYVLSYNATAGKFEWYNIGAELDEINSDTTQLKQDFSKYHPDLGSGYSAQLLSTVFIEDEVPYNYRSSGGSADIGDREYDEIVGVSMPVNQLAYNPNFEGTSNWYIHSALSVTASNHVVECIASAKNASMQNYGIRNASSLDNHVVLVMCDLKADESYSIEMLYGDNTVFTEYPSRSIGTTWATYSLMAKRPTVTMSAVYVGLRDYHESDWKKFYVRNFNTFDLTQMLGTTIADYVYGLEQSTAGSGVSWLKHHFPKIFDAGYISYNAGEMQSVSGLSAHKMTGFNQWDEVWELGGFAWVTGEPITANDRIRAKNFNRCVPNTVYCATKRIAFFFYDGNKNFISYAYNDNATKLITTPVNAAYFKVLIENTTTYANDICVNFHWDGERDGEYEEYKEYVYPLDDSVVLRGILKLDSDNKLYADGDRYLADGTIRRNWNLVNMKDQSLLKNVLSSDDWLYYALFYDARKDVVLADQLAILDKFTVIDSAPIGTNGGNAAFRYLSSASCGILYVNMHGLINENTVEAAEAYFDSHPVFALYAIEPTTETAEPYQTPQIVDDWGTEEYVSTSLVPVGHDTKYANNLRAKLEMSPASPEEDGDYIVRHNNGENEYVALGSTTTIQGILDRLTALENA